MNWFGLILVAYWLTNIVVSILMIGKPTTRYTPPVVAFLVIVYGLLILGVVTVGTA